MGVLSAACSFHTGAGVATAAAKAIAHGTVSTEPDGSFKIQFPPNGRAVP